MLGFVWKSQTVVSMNLHGLFVDRIIPQTIALYKSITQVRDRSLRFEKKKKSKRSTNLDILMPLKFGGFIVSSSSMEAIKVPIKRGEF